MERPTLESAGKRAVFLFQPLRPTLMGTTRTRAFFSKKALLSPFPRGSKTFAVSTPQGNFSRQRRVAAPEEFWPKFSVVQVATQKTLS